MINWAKDIFILEREGKAALINYNQESWVRVNKKALDDCRCKIVGKEPHNLEAHHRDLYETLKAYNIVLNSESPKDKLQINSIYFLTTLQCNMECDFCCVSASPNYKETAMESKDIKSFINKIAKEKVKKVILTGGEPFLRNDLEEIILLLKSKTNCKVQVCTNGLLMKMDKKLFEAIDMIDISVENLYSSDSETGKTDLLVNKLNMLKQQNVSICLSYVITKYNWARVYEFLDFAYENDVNISLKVVSPSGRAEHNKEVLLNKDQAYNIMTGVYYYIYNKRYFSDKMTELLFPAYVPSQKCAASGKILSIYPDGKVYSCFMLNKPQFLLGNIKNSSFSEILHRINNNNSTELYKKCFNKDCKEICKKCFVRYFCEGNCFGVSEGQSNNILCEFYKIYFTFYIWEYSEHNNLEENLQNFIAFLESGKENE